MVSPGGARRSQDEPGGAQRGQGQPGGARRSKEKTGGRFWLFLKVLQKCQAVHPASLHAPFDSMGHGRILRGALLGDQKWPDRPMYKFGKSNSVMIPILCQFCSDSVPILFRFRFRFRCDADLIPRLTAIQIWIPFGF